jgi:short-chain fatty acids transporter
MLDRVTVGIVRFFERWMPDALVVAVVLTLLTLALVLGLTDTSPRGAIDAWGDGFWSLLAFTNQIALTLLLGYALASTAPVRSALLKASGLVRSPRSAYVMVCLLTGLIAVFSWSTALVAAGIVSRAVGEGCRRRGIRVHYPLLIASAFSGFVVWHQGFSASIPLTIATPGHFLESQIGVIPTSETLFTWRNGLTVAAILLTLPWVMALLHPRKPESIQEIPDHLYSGDEPSTDEAPIEGATVPVSPAMRLEQSRILVMVTVAGGLLFLLTHYGTRGDGLTLNIMNFTLLMVGLLCAGTLQRYLQALSGGGDIVIPFLLQYPFYAGIAGLIATSGLGNLIVEGATSIASADSLPLIGFLSAGLLNIFIPSGGAQWAVQGPIMMTAAQQLGADLPATAMAVALGDQWTNLIQPLILLPVLTLAQLPARAVMGYTFIALLWTGGLFMISIAVV